MDSYGIDQGVFRNIARESLKKYAPNYYDIVLIDKKGEHLHRGDSEDPWYALTGYRYLSEKGEFLVATTVPDYGTAHECAPIDSLPWLELSLSSRVDIQKLESDIKKKKGKNSSVVPFLAWKDFEHSFAPLYSAFGIRTVGNNLTAISVDGVPTIDYYPVHIHPAFYAFVKFLRGWYEDGLIDSDFLEVDYKEALERASSGDYSYVSTPRGRTIVRPNLLFEAFYRATHSPISLFQVTRYDHTERSFVASPFEGAEAYLWCVPDEKIGPLLRAFEYTRWPGGELYLDREESPGWIERIFGRLDIHYESEQGQIVPHKARVVDREEDPLFSGDRHEDAYAMWHFKVLPEITLSWAHETRILQYGIVSKVEPHEERLIGDPFREPRELGEAVEQLRDEGYEREQVDELFDSLSTLATANVARWLTGTASIENEWDTYVSDWEQHPAGAAIIRAIGQ